MSIDAKKLVKEGYADLLKIPADAFGQSQAQIFETPARDQPAWAKWVIPIWIVRFDAMPVCSVSPAYVNIAKQVMKKISDSEILSRELLISGRALLNSGGSWHQREIFAYLKNAPVQQSAFHADVLSLKDRDARRLLNLYDGGAVVIRDGIGEFIAYAGIKDKGKLQEIAVWTHEAHRGKGMAKSVVYEAIKTILNAGKIPIYIPDNLDNVASYRVAQSLGFENIGETIFWEYELENWKGFLQEGLFRKTWNWLLKNL
jgi:RimJ/RimL family protein N-acetyltransferase